MYGWINQSLAEGLADAETNARRTSRIDYCTSRIAEIETETETIALTETKIEQVVPVVELREVKVCSLQMFLLLVSCTIISI
jgi:hypothetical protein